MCNLYSTITSQASPIALFRVVNRYVGNLPPIFPDYPALVGRNAACGSTQAAAQTAALCPVNIQSLPELVSGLLIGVRQAFGQRCRLPPA